MNKSKNLLREAANELFEEYAEFATQEPTGVMNVGIGENQIYFYVRSEDVVEKLNLPKKYKGFNCKAKVLREPVKGL